MTARPETRPLPSPRVPLALLALLVAASACSPDEGAKCAGVTCESTVCAEALCNPETGQCELTPRPIGTVCRDASGPCDLAERCSGLTCPEDSFKLPTAVCRPADGECDEADFCTGESAACPADRFADGAVVCREAAAACDAEERCTGESSVCPADGFASAETVCRPAAAACDRPETCSGEGAECPGDAYLPVETPCRPVAGACDSAEVCSGEGPECPADLFAEAGTECRAAKGVCDLPESCTGAGAACPFDTRAPPGRVCREVAGPCDAEERCAGEDDCPADLALPAGSVCRNRTGPCDAEEACDGAGFECPADALEPVTTVCRAASSLCDLEERCTGASAQCPEDLFEAAQTICRPAAGDCDEAERCTGLHGSCPGNAFLPSATVCRASAGGCDPEERCTGVLADCPDDALRPPGFVCRATAGDCDLEDTCDGTGAGCPDDLFVAADASCEPASCIDGVARAERTCDGLGLCRAALPEPCAPYACGATACLTSCASSDDCAIGLFCLAGACVERGSYSDWWAGGTIGATGVSLAIGSDGTRSIAAVHGRRLLVYSAGPGETSWASEVVAGFATDPRMKIDGGDRLHLAWQDQGFDSVRYATRGAAGWESSHVGEGHAPSLGVDSAGRPHVAFHAFVGTGSVNKLATRDDGTWSVEPISSGGGMGCGCINDPTSHCSCGREPGRPYLEVGPDDVVRVLFPRYAVYQGIEYATRRPAGWEFEEIESAWFLEGATSVAVAQDGSSHLAYAVIGDVLRVTSNQTGAWVREDTALGTGGQTSLAHAGARHLCGFDPALYYATDASGGWVRTLVDDTVRNARHCSLALDPAGAVHIAYGEGDTGSLKIADNASGAFAASFVDRATLFGGRIGLAVDAAGRDHLAAPRRAFFMPQTWVDYQATYWTDRGGAPAGIELTSIADLRPRLGVSVDAQGFADVAFYQNPAAAQGLIHATNRGGAWAQTLVATGEDAGRDFWLAAGPDGLPRLAFRDAGQVRLARHDGANWSTETVESVNGGSLALAVGGTGANHLLYSTAVLRHATDAAGTWQAEVVNPAGNGFMPNAIAVAPSGTLHAVFWSDGQGLHYGRDEGAGWLLEPLAASNGVSINQVLTGDNEYSIVVDDEETVHVILANSDQQLVGLARRAGTWVGTIYDKSAGDLEGVSAFKAPDGSIHIGYVADGALFRAIVPAS